LTPVLLLVVQAASVASPLSLLLLSSVLLKARALIVPLLLLRLAVL
jgi:hypothetical protein